MTALTFQQMAGRLDVPWCGGLMPSGFYCRADHRDVGSISDGIVHLAEPTLVDRRDALAFLRLAVQVLDPTINDDIPWRRVYRLYRGVWHAADVFHLRFAGRRYWGADKAFVLAGVAGLSNDVPMRRQAFDWARR